MIVQPDLYVLSLRTTTWKEDSPTEKPVTQPGERFNKSVVFVVQILLSWGLLIVLKERLILKKLVF
jgi:hypothetical protein